jgi:hypothetical protein
MIRLYALFLPAVLLAPASLPTASTPSTALVAAPAANQDSGKQTEDRKVGSFTAIAADGPVYITLTQGNETKVQLAGPAEHIKEIVTEVRNGTLYISYNGRMYDYGNYNGRNNDKFKTKLEVNITAPQIKTMDLSRACMLTTATAFAADKLQLQLTGASVVNIVDLAAQSLDIESMGASMVTLSGTVKTLDCKVAGASVLRAFDLKADNVAIEVTGASTASVYADAELAASVFGVSSLRYKGKATIKDLQTGGGGVFRKAQ